MMKLQQLQLKLNKNSKYRVDKKTRKNRALTEVKVIKKIKKRKTRKKRKVREKNKQVYQIKFLLKNNLWALAKDK